MFFYMRSKILMALEGFFDFPPFHSINADSVFENESN